MPEEKNINNPDVLFSWMISEYEQPLRTRNWYIGAISVAVVFLIFAIISKNFLFAVIIIISALIYILHDGSQPMKVLFAVEKEGIKIGRKFYDFDEIATFAVVYKPKMNVKNLYFEFKNVFQHRLSIPLLDVDPIHVREILLRFLKEDLERTDMPLSESLARLFRL